eukprot:89607-Amphidinium_carterae.1
MGPLCVGGFPLVCCAGTLGDSSFGAAAALSCCQSGFSVSTTPCGLSGGGGAGVPLPSRAGATAVLARSIF